MQRRAILRRAFSIVSLGFVTVAGSSVVGFGRAPSVRRTMITFPAGKSFADFQAEMHQWMHVEKWLAYVESIKQDGSLLEMKREVYSDRVVFEYRFDSNASLLAFQSAGEECDVNLSARKKLGYSHSVEFA